MSDDKFRPIVHALESVHTDFHPLVLQFIHDLLGAKPEAYAKAYASVRLGIEGVASRPVVQPENIGGQIVGEALPLSVPANVSVIEVVETASRPLYAGLQNETFDTPEKKGGEKEVSPPVVPDALAQTMGSEDVCVSEASVVPRVCTGHQINIPQGPIGVLATQALSFEHPGRSTPFVVAKHLVVNVSDAADVPISYIDPKLLEEFGGLTIPAYGRGTLILQKVLTAVDNTQIMGDIRDSRLKTNLALLAFVLRHMYLEKCLHKMYMETGDDCKMLREVFFYWENGGWSIHQALTFRSDTCPVGTVVISQW